MNIIINTIVAFLSSLFSYSSRLQEQGILEMQSRSEATERGFRFAFN